MKEWRKQKILDLYIHDYLVRKKMKTTADILALEAGVQVKSVALDEGFLEDFWSIFWDVYVSRLNKNPQEDQATTSEAASSDLSVTENTCIKSDISPAMKSRVMGSLLQNGMIPNQFGEVEEMMGLLCSEMTASSYFSVTEKMCKSTPTSPEICNTADTQNEMMGNQSVQTPESVPEEEMIRDLAAEMEPEISEETCSELNNSKLESIFSELRDSLVQPNVVERTLPEPTSDERWTEGHFRHL